MTGGQPGEKDRMDMNLTDLVDPVIKAAAIEAMDSCRTLDDLKAFLAGFLVGYRESTDEAKEKIEALERRVEALEYINSGEPE